MADAEFRSPLALRVGHASDARLKSGVTLFLPDEPAVAAVHVAGGGPGTRETDLLRPESTVARVDALVLSGGSAFGLAAADGVTNWLASRGRGYAVGVARVPIVPGAILFDLLNGGDKTSLPGMGGRTPAPSSPYAGLGWEACERASRAVPLGSVGAGTGATTANLKGGFGAAAATLSGGAAIVAFAAVNSLGRVTLGDGPHLRAAPFEVGGEFGGLGFPAALPADAAAPIVKGAAIRAPGTTLAVVATDLALSKADAKRLAIAAHDGIALGLYPAHLPLDGDTVFVLATGERHHSGIAELSEACAIAPACLARAIARGVYEAVPAPGDTAPTWKERHAGSVSSPNPR